MPFSSKPNAVLGRPLDRRDARLKVTGTALYAADHPVKNLAYGVLVVSTIPAGRIVSLDASVAMRVPGMLYVLSHDNAQALKAGSQGAVRPAGGRAVTLLQSDAVLYHGQPIAVVVADTLEQAKAGAELVRVRYATTASVLDFEQAKASAYTPTVSKGGADTSHGDVDAALRTAGLRIDAGYSTPMEHHNPMEPHATIAAWDGDRLTIHDSTQAITGARKSIAGALGIDAKNIHVVCPFVGGGFGCKGSTWSHVVLAAMAAQAVQRPVKVVLERPQMWGPIGGRPQTDQRIALASSADGRLLATRHAVVSHTSMFEDYPETSAVVTRMLYDSDTRETTHRVLKLNVGTPTYMRAPGEASGSFALESAMDEMAERAGMDPVEFRLRNYAEKNPTDGLPWSSKSLRDCYLIGADRFGWSKRNARAGAGRDGHELIGYGMASATYPTNRSKASARATIGPDGIAIVQSGTQDLGTGTWTVMAQVAAETLGFPFDKVRFELGDSDYPEAPNSGGSTSVSSVSPAVQAACLEARAQLIQIAIKDAKSPLANSKVDDVTIQNGWFQSISSPGRREAVAVVMRRANTPVVTEATTAPGEDAKNWSKHAFGAVFVEARVDADLGRIRIPRVVGVYGVGNRLNEKTAHSQLMGGIVWGISMALFEESLIDVRNGRFVNASLAEYHVPVNADIGEIDISFVNEDDPHVNPLGAKGIGEIGITGVAGAVANAVYNATGKRVRDLPITLDKVIAA